MINQELITGLFSRIGDITASTLSQALGRNVRVSPAVVSVKSKSAIAGETPEASAIVCAAVQSPRPGIIIQAFPPPLDTLLPELIINPNAAARPARFTELHRGALGEVMLRIWSSAAPLLAGQAGATLSSQQPEVMHTDPGACLTRMPAFTGIENFVVSAHHVRIADAEEGRMLILLPAVFLKEMLQAEKPEPAPRRTAPGNIEEIPLEHVATPREEHSAPKPSRITHKRRPSAPHDATPNLNALMDVPMDVVAELGKAEMSIEDIMALAPGRVVELDQESGAPIKVIVNGKPIARGTIVSVGENFGLKITDIIEPKERL